jgi:hypothetical protein
VRMADNLTTFMCRLSRNLGASTSWNPVGLSRPVMGLLYLFFLGIVGTGQNQIRFNEIRSTFSVDEDYHTYMTFSLQIRNEESACKTL